MKPVYDFHGSFATFTLRRIADLMEDLNCYLYPALQRTDPYHTIVASDAPGTWDQEKAGFELSSEASNTVTGRDVTIVDQCQQMNSVELPSSADITDYLSTALG